MHTGNGRHRQPTEGDSEFDDLFDPDTAGDTEVAVPSAEVLGRYGEVETPVLHSDADLAGRGARGAAVTIAGQLTRIALQFIGLIVLARLLTPRDYGLLASVTAIVGIGDIIRDFGLSAASVQAKQISSAQRTNLFWCNTLIGFVVAGAAEASSWWIADFYGQSQLVSITQILAVTLFFSSVTAQFRADLNRSFKFGKMSIIDISSQTVGLTVAIAVATTGHGYWALVLQQLTQSVWALVLTLYFDDWRPGRPVRDVPMRQFWRFGRNLAGTQMLGYLSRNVDSITIGHRFGSVLLGIYDRAFTVLMLPLDQIGSPMTRVALPVLARLQDSRQKFQDYLVRAQTVVTNLTVGIFTYAIALAPYLFHVVYGPQWASSVVVFQLLAVAGIFQTVAQAGYWAFIAKGLTNANFRYSIVSRPIVIAGILIGSEWGIRGVATGYSIGLIIIWPMQTIWVSKRADVSGRVLWWRGVRSIVAYLPAGLIAAGVTHYFGSSSQVVDLLFGTAVYFAALVATYVLSPGYRDDIAAILDTVRRLRKR